VRADRAPLVAGLLAVTVVLAGFGLYVLLGEPRIVHADARQHLADRPGDGRGWVLLARQEFERGRYLEASEAYGKAIAASRKVAGDPAVWCEFADAVGMAQGRRLAGRPAELIARALALGPNEPCALEMAGSLAYESGDRASAASHWRQLLAQLPPGGQSHRELTAAIERAEGR
jgi:cytochrome c-type biogenesis protein CcmH